MSVQSGEHAFNTISHSFLVFLNAADIITLKLKHNDVRANLTKNASFYGAFLLTTE